MHVESHKERRDSLKIQLNYTHFTLLTQFKKSPLAFTGLLLCLPFLRLSVFVSLMDLLADIHESFPMNIHEVRSSL